LLLEFLLQILSNYTFLRCFEHGSFDFGLKTASFCYFSLGDLQLCSYHTCQQFQLVGLHERGSSRSSLA
jgi:hypothetical protein